MPIICLQVGLLPTNCYLLYDENKQGVIVDPGGDEALIMSTIKKQGLTIEHILLTHVHFDHILAVPAVQKATGADLLVPRADEPALNDGERSLLTMIRQRSFSALKADRLLDDGDTITAGNLTLKVLHTPGHTPGSSCYLCENMMLSGDTLFAGEVGRTDFPGGDENAIRRSIRRLAQLEGDYTVLPGHEEQTTLSAERRGNPYMSEHGFNY